MPIAFDRSVCCDLNETISREWLVTNGLGGYAAGTVAGVLTRMQHGLLVSSPVEAETPQLLLAKIDEEILFDERTYYLGTNEYRDGTLNPSGFVHLEMFRLEEGFPILTYRIGGIDGILLEKRIWMPQDQNTTCIQYRVLRSALADETTSGIRGWHQQTGRPEAGYGRYGQHGYSEAPQRSLTLTLLPLAAYRPHHQPQYGNNDWHFQVQVHKAAQSSESTQGTSEEDLLALPHGVAGCTIRAQDNAHPYHIFAVGAAESGTTFIPTGVWYWHFSRRHDEAAGRPAQDDLYLPGVIRAKLWPGEEAALTIIVSAEEFSSLPLTQNQINLSYCRNVEQRRSLNQPQRYFGEGGKVTQELHTLPLGREETTSEASGDTDQPAMDGEEYLRLLLQAGDRFLVNRRLPHREYDGSPSPFFREPEYTSLLLSDYYEMQSNTRDTLIALPGLTLATGRYEEAMRILRNLGRRFRQGLLPDRLPLPGSSLQESEQESNYGSVDTTLWYFYALDAYLRTTHNYELLDELYHHFVDSIQWYTQGTCNGIQVDPDDGLLRAQQADKALTWMNAYADGKAVTPRSGKPVEVNALWYNALSLMHEWSHYLHSQGRIVYSSDYYGEQATRCKESFQQRFWYESANGAYLYDVIDGPEGNDAALRPNQLLAISLRYPVLDTSERVRVLEQVTRYLLTPYGLRTLSPQAANYRGSLEGSPEDEQRSLHQGSAWPWLLGPYIDAMQNIAGGQQAHMSARQEKQLRQQEQRWHEGIQLLLPFQEKLREGMLGMIGATFAGDAPHRSGGSIASALSTGEILRVYNLLAQLGVHYQARVLSA